MFAPLESTRVEAQVWRICGTWRCCGGPGGASWCAALSPHADPAARRRRRSFRSPSRSLAPARPPALPLAAASADRQYTCLTRA